MFLADKSSGLKLEAFKPLFGLDAHVLMHAQDAIDWRRLRVLWSPSRPNHAPRAPSLSPGPVASSPDSAGRQSQSVRGAAADDVDDPAQLANQVQQSLTILG